MSNPVGPVAKLPPLIEWGVAARNLPGEVVSGDLYIVQESDMGVLVGVVDALGHGSDAAAAAALAVASLARHAHEPLSEIVQGFIGTS